MNKQKGYWTNNSMWILQASDERNNSWFCCVKFFQCYDNSQILLLKLSYHNLPQTQPLTGLSPKQGHSLGSGTSYAWVAETKGRWKKKTLNLKKNAIFCAQRILNCWDKIKFSTQMWFYKDHNFCHSSHCDDLLQMPKKPSYVTVPKSNYARIHSFKECLHAFTLTSFTKHNSIWIPKRFKIINWHSTFTGPFKTRG